MDNRPIGVFDSGIGGLTVALQLMKTLPNEQIVYFGDNLRVPYGTRSKPVIIDFSRQIMNFLCTQKIKMAIIACNTIGCNSYEVLSSEYNVPILEVLTSTAKVVPKLTKNKSVGVIATQSTVDSNVYKDMIQKIDSEINVYSYACPLLVNIVEEGWYDTKVAIEAVKLYLEEPLKREIDVLILGCTHYPLLKKHIKQEAYGVNIVDPAKYTIESLLKMLTKDNSLREDLSLPKHKFFVSGRTDKFDKIYESITGDKIKSIKIDIEKY